ncbi:MAG: VacJ family lipoprotein [Pseudomonadota bacterium]
MRPVAGLLLLLLLAGCSALKGHEYAVIDPSENANRASYRISDGVDRAVLIPVAQGYRSVTPDWVEKRLVRFFVNLRHVPSALNGALQGKPARAATDLGRFLVNSTVGVAGLFDVASDFGWRFGNEDFGQTLAVWGYTRSRYIYVPFLGPSTVRDLPTTLFRGALPRVMLGSQYHWGVGVADVVSRRAGLLDATRARDTTALDGYAFTRDAYFQQRTHAVYDGAPPLDDLFDEFDEFDDDELEDLAD